MKSSGVLSLALVAALAAACNQPRSPNERGLQESEDSGSAGGGAAANDDVFAAANDFASRVAASGMAEIELGEMAAGRAQHPDVRSFGDMMVRDHTASSDELKQIAASHGIVLPTQRDDRQRQLRDRLSALRGAEFDRAYMDAMIEEHQDLLELLRTRGSEVGSDAADRDLNQFAAKARPTAQLHLDEARRISDSLDAGRSTQR